MSLRTCGAMKSHTACSLWPAARAWHTEDPMLQRAQLTGRLDARRGQGGQIGLLSGADVELAALQGARATDNGWPSAEATAWSAGSATLVIRSSPGRTPSATTSRAPAVRPPAPRFCRQSGRPSVARLHGTGCPTVLPGAEPANVRYLMAAAMSPDIAPAGRPSYPSRAPRPPGSRSGRCGRRASGSGRRRCGRCR